MPGAGALLAAIFQSMDAPLHLEDEGVYLCARQLQEQSVFIRQQAQSLAVAVRSMNWLGEGRDLFQSELEEIAVLLDRRGDEVNILAAHLRNTIDLWCNLDQQYETLYSRLIMRHDPE